MYLTDSLLLSSVGILWIMKKENSYEDKSNFDHNDKFVLKNLKEEKSLNSKLCKFNINLSFLKKKK